MTVPGSLRVATYNIRKCIGLDWRRRPDRILAVLAEIGADVVALQEADRRFGAREATLPPEALAEAGWRPVRVARGTQGLGWHGNVLLLGPDAEAEDAQAIDLPFLEPRGAVAATVRVRGLALRVVGMHLGLTPRPRLRQAAAIIAELERGPPHPTVLMGDTNEWREFEGCLGLFGTRHRLSAPTPTFHAARPVAALDRIAVSAEFEFAASGAHDTPLARRASDHLPLWADLVPAAAR